MISDVSQPREAFVWIWLPGQISPVVAGRVRVQDSRHIFTYGRSYLAREDAVPVYAPELPLRPGPIEPEPPLDIANALRDAAPDPSGTNRWLPGQCIDVEQYGSAIAIHAALVLASSCEHTGSRPDRKASP